MKESFVSAIIQFETARIRIQQGYHWQERRRRLREGAQPREAVPGQDDDDFDPSAASPKFKKA